MTVIMRIACLANSRKFGGRCIAGKKMAPALGGHWVRPISARVTEEVSEEERRYQNGSDPRVLDIIDVPLKVPHPRTYQSENWVIEPEQPWELAGRLVWSDLETLADNPPTLWLNNSNSYNGLHDRVLLADAERLSSSLYLLHVRNLAVRVFAPGEAFGNPKRRVQAILSHRGVEYRLWVTDAPVEREFLAMVDGEYRIGEAYVTVSLAEPHDDGYSYKLVAAIIRPDVK